LHNFGQPGTIRTRGDLLASIAEDRFHPEVIKETLSLLVVQAAIGGDRLTQTGELIDEVERAVLGPAQLPRDPARRRRDPRAALLSELAMIVGPSRVDALHGETHVDEQLIAGEVTLNRSP